MGSAAAFHLAARNKRVLGIEQFTRAHDKGSSHGDSRIIRQAYYEDPAYVPLVQRAYELWEKLERDSGEKLLRITGGLMIGEVGSRLLTGSIASAVQHHLPYEVLDRRAVAERYPVLKLRESDAAVFETRAGYVRPEAAVRAHLQQAELHGANIHFEEKVLHWEVAPSGSVRVTTDRAVYEADQLVISPGAWAPDLLAELGIPFVIRRHVMGWFASSDHAGFSPDRFPIYMWDVDTTSVFYGFPATGPASEGVKVAMHSGGEICTATTINRTITRYDEDELRQHLARFIPALDGPLLRAATCLYTLTPDEHFVLSLHPRHPQVAVAAGFSGHGFKFSSAVGEVLADLVTQGSSPLPLQLFSPARFRATA